MALEAYQTISLTTDLLLSTRPASILEIGVGSGLNGLIARDLLDSKLNGNTRPQDWETIIDGIVGPDSAVDAHLNPIYTQVYAGRAIDILKTLQQYDLILINDTLEHESKEQALDLLHACMMHSNRWVIVSVRIGKTWQSLNPADPAFKQSSDWYIEDFSHFSTGYEIIDGPLGPYGVFPIIKENYLGHQLEQLTLSNKLASQKLMGSPADLSISKAGVARIDLSRLASFVADKNHLAFFMDSEFREHYRLLAYLSTLFDHACIFDVGTNKGYSALALSYNQTNTVVSYDIVDLKSLNRIEELNRIEFQIGDVLEDDRLASSPLIMLDTNHDGKFEIEFFNFLRAHNYQGLVFLDDIHVCNAMIRFWVSIPEPKLDLTHLGHFSGSGLVDFSTQEAFRSYP